jgi:predicted RNase H-like HicB family nuclease
MIPQRAYWTTSGWVRISLGLFECKMLVAPARLPISSEAEATGRATYRFSPGVRRNLSAGNRNESGYVAAGPALPGCVSGGNAGRHCVIRKGIETYIEALLEDGLPVPR